MAWPTALGTNLQETLAVVLDDYPGVSGIISVECATNVAGLGTTAIPVNIPSDSTATS
jgi:hypothetical protein